MMRRVLGLAIILLSVLLVWQLVQQRPAGNAVYISPERVSSVVVAFDSAFFPEKNAEIVLSDRDEVLDFCQLWNQNWATEIMPYALYSWEDAKWVDMPVGASDSLRVKFQFVDDTARYFSLMEEFLFDRGADDAHYYGYYFHTSVDLVTTVKSMVPHAAAVKGDGT